MHQTTPWKEAPLKRVRVGFRWALKQVRRMMWLLTPPWTFSCTHPFLFELWFKACITSLYVALHLLSWGEYLINCIFFFWNFVRMNVHLLPGKGWCVPYKNVITPLLGTYLSHSSEPALPILVYSILRCLCSPSAWFRTGGSLFSLCLDRFIMNQQGEKQLSCSAGTSSLYA